VFRNVERKFGISSFKGIVCFQVDSRRDCSSDWDLYLKESKVEKASVHSVFMGDFGDRGLLLGLVTNSALLRMVLRSYEFHHILERTYKL
jgi:hypothetical protein